MKNVYCEGPTCFYRSEAMLCFCKHPEVDLLWECLAAAYEKAFYARCVGESEGYAQNTTARD